MVGYDCTYRLQPISETHQPLVDQPKKQTYVFASTKYIVGRLHVCLLIKRNYNNFKFKICKGPASGAGWQFVSSIISMVLTAFTK